MRPLRIGALFLALATPALGQRPDPSSLRPSLAPSQAPQHGHPFLDRAEYLRPRIVGVGAVIGIVAGALQPHPADREEVFWNGILVGSAIGFLASAATAGLTDFVPHPITFFEHRPRRRRDMSRYLIFGTQLGLGVGTMFAVHEGAGHADDHDTEAKQGTWVLGGAVGGLVSGLVTYLVQH